GSEVKLHPEGVPAVGNPAQPILRRRLHKKISDHLSGTLSRCNILLTLLRGSPLCFDPRLRSRSPPGCKSSSLTRPFNAVGRPGGARSVWFGHTRAAADR